VPAGSRTSTYRIAHYQKVADSVAQSTLDSVANADVNHPTVDAVPSIGVQYVGIPEFQELGTQGSQQFAAVIAGPASLDDALARAQQLADEVGKKYRK